MLQLVLTPCTFPRPPPPWQLERTLENLERPLGHNSARDAQICLVT